MSVLKRKRSEYNDHCIIQWGKNSEVISHYKESDFKYCKRAFYKYKKIISSTNKGSQYITSRALEIKKENTFLGLSYDESKYNITANSYKISPKMFMMKTVPVRYTTDLFIMGHSGERAFISDEGLRIYNGISIDGRLVDIAQLGEFLDTVCKSLRGIQLRVWIISCGIASSRPSQTSVLEQLIQTLKSSGWKNKQIIGFERNTTVDTLNTCRVIASKTDLFAPLDLSKLKILKPHCVTF